jgi:hypothetical protein
MKKLIFLMVLVPFLIGNKVVMAQEDNNFRFTLKTNPLSALGGPLFIAIVPICGEYKIIFEAKTAAKQSVETGFGYLGSSVLLNLNEIASDSVESIKTTGFRGQVAYKFFLTKDPAPEGFYVGPHVSYARATIKNSDNTDENFTASKLNVNVLFGYQLITSGGFTLNIYTGLGAKMRDYSFAEGSESIFDFDTGKGFTPNVPFGFTFGYAF